MCAKLLRVASYPGPTPSFSMLHAEKLVHMLKGSGSLGMGLAERGSCLERTGGYGLHYNACRVHYCTLIFHCRGNISVPVHEAHLHEPCKWYIGFVANHIHAPLQA